MILALAIWAIPTFTALTAHEAAHALAATLLGDSTPRLRGRLTLSPAAHLGLIGGLLVPLLSAALTGGAFGWGIPLPVDLAVLRRRRFGVPLMALAGPAANLLFAAIWAASLRYIDLGSIFTSICKAGVLVNLWLGQINLLPIPPLDGSHLIRGSSDRVTRGTFHPHFIFRLFLK